MTAGGQAVAGHRVGLRRLAALLAGRASFRLLLYGSAAVLALAWTAQDFNAYSAAVGAVNWLGMLIQAGTEKAALKLVPRARRTKDQILGTLRAVTLYVPLPFTAVAVAAVVFAPGATATLYLLAIAYYVALGCGMLGVALHRALERYNRDTAYFALLGLGMAGMAGLAFALRVPPEGYLCGLLALTTALNLGLLPGLPRARANAGVRRVLAGTAVLMGAADVLHSAQVGVLFLELALTPHATGSGHLYLVTLGWTFAGSVIYTVQRIYQPRLSARIANGGTAAAKVLARRVTGAVTWLSAAWLLSAGSAVAITRPSGPFALVALLVTLLPIHTLMNYGVFILENTDGTDLRASARAAIIGLAVVAALGAVAIPLFGTAGAIVALGANELAVSLTAGRTSSLRARRGDAAARPT
ncbi:hypothetical protein OIE66_25305 [Nonomuraea sp. NBC_01738]|uniref:hypothetical protein n=1 Tax=Nonomuraea sp. NBC_01738 TaxID=2976003 RepID=UPI002E158598|nr:hypothetical protein OIE66_25305 [Nonomuraea sp. NBC_01738]